MATEGGEDKIENIPENLVTLTIRLIRSFEFRNIKFLVIKHVDLNWTTEKLIEKTNEEIQKCSNLPKPFRTFQYDTMKVCFFRHPKFSLPTKSLDNHFVRN